MTDSRNVWVFIEQEGGGSSAGGDYAADGQIAAVSLELLAKGGELANTLKLLRLEILFLSVPISFICCCPSGVRISFSKILFKVSKGKKPFAIDDARSMS